MEQFLSFPVFDIWAIAALSAMFIVLIIQIVFYLLYYKKPVSYYKKTNQETTENQEYPSVSVVIVAKNESKNLEKILPVILNQDYPDYEVIVVNEGSTDQSEFLLKRLKLEYPHLYSTFLPEPYESISRRHKVLAMTIGIKAATKDVLLFTEADSCPVGSDWIKSMMGNLTPDKDIVVGYCKYSEQSGLWGNIVSFDTLIWTLQYTSMAIKNKPFMGIYRNVAYRKHLFFDNKGFSSSLQYENSEDVFLNNVMNSRNTAVALSHSSFVESELVSFSMWKFIKSNYMRAKSHFKNYTPRIFHLESASRYLFYLFTLVSIVYCSIKSLWIYLIAAVSFFFIRFFIQFFTLKSASEHFQIKSFSLSLPFVDIMQLHYNAYFHYHSRKKRKEK